MLLEDGTAGAIDAPNAEPDRDAMAGVGAEIGGVAHPYQVLDDGDVAVAHEVDSGGRPHCQFLQYLEALLRHSVAVHRLPLSPIYDSKADTRQP